jgi:hypothetical protein
MRGSKLFSTLFMLGALLGVMGAFASLARAAEHRAYEGVVSLKQLPIGTVILLDIQENAVSGWLRLEKNPVAIDGGSVSPDGVEFRSSGNTYQIDDRKRRINYSGPQGEGNRLITPLTRLTGRLEELVEETEKEPPTATIEVDGRRRDLHYGAPALWKRNGPPFINFDRLDELLGKQITVWAAEADLRSGRIVVIEEPEGMDIPLKAPKKPKEPQKENSDKQDKK